LIQNIDYSEDLIYKVSQRRGALQDAGWPKLSHALGRPAEAPIFIYRDEVWTSSSKSGCPEPTPQQC
jgi:hypothetical protein